jgi:pyrroline-5-carboxylate reductase
MDRYLAAIYPGNTAGIHYLPPNAVVFLCESGRVDERVKATLLQNKQDMETLMDAGTSVAGCGPAFAFLFMEALEEGGVRCGLPRDKARQYAQQMLLGAAQLALETGKDPVGLRQAVCSPAGSTIEGVRAMQADGLEESVARAVQASYRRNRELGNAK